MTRATSLAWIFATFIGELASLGDGATCDAVVGEIIGAGSYATLNQTEDADACCQACLDDEACLAWTFETDQKTCYFKDDIFYRYLKVGITEFAKVSEGHKFFPLCFLCVSSIPSIPGHGHFWVLGTAFPVRERHHRPRVCDRSHEGVSFLRLEP